MNTYTPYMYQMAEPTPTTYYENKDNEAYAQNNAGLHYLNIDTNARTPLLVLLGILVIPIDVNVYFIGIQSTIITI